MQRHNVCGGTTYALTFKMCCRDTAQDRTGLNPKCCGTEAYDADFKMCCDDTIQDKPFAVEQPACCGTQSYDT